MNATEFDLTGIEKEIYPGYHCDIQMGRRPMVEVEARRVMSAAPGKTVFLGTTRWDLHFRLGPDEDAEVRARAELVKCASALTPGLELLYIQNFARLRGPNDAGYSVVSARMALAQWCDQRYRVYP